MSYETIQLSIEPPLATLQLHRPGRMNAVIEQMYRDIRDALASCANEPDVRALLLTGSVLRRNGVDKQAFCAGADLKQHATGERSAKERRAYIQLAHETTLEVWRYPKPIVAAVNGPARGAGTELALNCDFIVIAEEASIGLPEVGLGTFVGGGVTYILPRLVGLAQAKELIYTGRILDGREALELGLAVRCCPLIELHDEARRLALRLAAVAPLSLTEAKRRLQDDAATMTTAVREETEAILRCMGTRDWREGLEAFARGREPKFEGR